MRYTTLVKRGGLVLSASLLMLAACHKDKTTTTTTTTTPTLTNADDNGGYASDAAKLESHSNDVISIADEAAASGGANLRMTSCATVTFDSAHHLLTIDFGTGCVGADGKTRRGKIKVSYTGRYKDSGSVHTITYDNYHVNDIQLKGYKSVTNMGRNSSGNYYYDVEVHDSLVFTTDSITSWNGSRTRTWTSGYSTPTRTDDSYDIGGTTTLTRANGHIFTMTIVTPLHVAYGCPYIESGVQTITSSSWSDTRTLDYGTTGCDNAATLTIGSHTYSITLR